MQTKDFARAVLLSLTCIAVHPAWSQVGHDPQPRKVLLEEFTALHCGNCPAGHVVAASIVAAHPDDVVLVNLHAGPLAVPSAGQPDLRNEWSTQLLTDLGVGFTPQGLVGRRAFAGTTLLSSGAWANASNAVLALPAVVNMAASTSFDALTRELTVQVELYYTADGQGMSDRLFVLLTEDHITGWQSNYGAGGNYPNYDHRHVLRAYLTALEGDPVDETTEGTTVVRTYTWTVPEEFTIENCRVVAFVGEGVASGIGEVLQVRATPAVAGATAYADSETATALRAFPVPATDVVTVLVTPAASARELYITDVGGRVVHRSVVLGGAEQITLSVGDLQPGRYHCRVDGARLGLVVVR